jgi:Sulfotransferase family
VEHFAPPEIHGNPARPSEGSLVFSLPAWDVLDLCKACGFAEAKMTFLVSSTYGVTSSLTPGIFVLSARKGTKEETARSPRRSRDTIYAGPDLRQVIGLLALPRSGTTLVSSIMGAHSRIKSVYEPWNDKKRVSLPDDIPIGDFLNVFSVDMASKSILFLKETATHIDYIDKVLDLLRSVPIAIQTNLVYLLRNPLHVFLSEFEARKTWWGENDLELTLEVFDRWAERTLTSLRRMFRAGAELNPLLVSYEALVTDKETIVKRLTERLGIRFEAAQLNFEKTVHKLDVRGDPKLGNNPMGINADSIRQRQRQISDIEHIVAESRYRDMLAAVGEAFEEVRSSTILQLNSPIAQQIFKQMVSRIATHN